MPSEVLDLKALSSSSFFSHDLRHSDEGQLGVWKLASMPNHRGASSSVEKLSMGDCPAENSLENHDSFPVRDQNASLILNRHAVGAERTSNYFARNNEVNMMNSQYESSLFSSSLSDIFTRKLRFSPSNALYGHSVDTVASHFEEEEVFESLEELEAQTIGNLLPDDDDLLAGVVTDGLDCLIETTGEDDAEDLDFFSNVGGMDLGDDGSSVVGQKNSESSGGLFNNLLGMHNGAMAGEHPLGEHPSRTLFVRNINSNVEDSELKLLFEQYGDIRTLYTTCKHRGFVMISYYDIRAARNAMKALQNKPLRRRKLDIHYSIPKDNPSEKDINQGTLVVFNLESSVSNEELRQIFGVYGEIKEIRESPHRSHYKFIEFYDIRAAEAALCALNLSDIAGKQIKLEPSHPGAVRRSLVQQLHPQLEREDIGLYLQQGSPPVSCSAGFSGLVPSGTIKSSSMSNGSVLGVHSMIRAPSRETELHHGISSSVPSSLPSVMRSESIGKQSGFIDSGHSPSPLKLGIRAAPAIHPHSLPEHHDSLNNNVHCNSLNTIAGNISLRPPERADSRQLVNFNGRSIELNEDVFASGGNRTCPIPGPHYTWGNSYRPQPPAPSVVWPNSPSYMNGIPAAHTPTQVHGVPRAASHLMHTVLPMNNHHVGSAPAVNPSIWDRQHAYAGELSKASGFHSGSIGNMNLPNNSPQSMEFFSHIFPQVGGNSVELPIPQRNVGLQSHHQRCMVFPGRGQILPMMNSFDSSNERGRSRRNEAAANQADKKQYELDIDRILRGEDNRTTLMIKNIPNKYTSKMLLAAIDERHRGTYDFIYLPIDFKNKCNVGYAFINMTDPSLIIPFYEAFNGIMLHRKSQQRSQSMPELSMSKDLAEKRRRQLQAKAAAKEAEMRKQTEPTNQTEEEPVVEDEQGSPNKIKSRNSLDVILEQQQSQPGFFGSLFGGLTTTSNAKPPLPTHHTKTAPTRRLKARSYSERLPTTQEEQDVYGLPKLTGAKEAEVLSDRRFASKLVPKIEACLPMRLRGYDWRLLYSLVQHGCSLHTLMRKVRGQRSTLIVIETCKGEIFGGFAASPWTNTGSYYGSGESFVFTNEPNFEVFTWKRQNWMFMYSNENSIAMGGGGGFAWYLNSDLSLGTSEACETFGNRRLTTDSHFEVANVEVWGFAMF